MQKSFRQKRQKRILSTIIGLGTGRSRADKYAFPSRVPLTITGRFFARNILVDLVVVIVGRELVNGRGWCDSIGNNFDFEAGNLVILDDAAIDAHDAPLQLVL